MASQAELRAMMRRVAGAAPVRRGTITNKLARYEADGRLACRVCNRVLGDDDALWEPHLQSAIHAESVAALKAKVSGKPTGPSLPAGAVSGMPTAPRPSPPVTGSAGHAIGAHVSLSAPAPLVVAASSARPGPLPVASAPAPPPSATPVATEPVAGQPKATASSAALLNTSAATAGFGRKAAAAASGGIATRGPPHDGDAAAGGGASSSALPAGFFDDVERDLRARGLDPKAVARAALEREWAEFQEFAAVVDAAEEDRAAAETASYEEQQAAAAVENALYRGRLDVVRFVQHKLLRSRQDSAGGSREAALRGEVEEAPLSATDEVLVEELAGPLSLLTSPDTGVQATGAAELTRLMLAQRSGAIASAEPSSDKPAGSDDSEEDDPDDLLDWRSKGVKRAKMG